FCIVPFVFPFLSFTHPSLRLFTAMNPYQISKFAKDALSRSKTRLFTFQKTANRKLKGHILQVIP
ncbi:hypothetical protein, partial [Prevotella sp. CAG:255]|uniref:hypothetical protein n=1 Tax=Prevotella sp. CAG:255 TaxID=1262923 RepID=UPI002590A1D7